MRGRHYRIIAKALNDSGTFGETWLVSDRHKQYLTTYNHNFESDIIWIGDIDGDGKLDIYFHEEGNGGVSDGCLYLSSISDKGELVGSVAPADGIQVRKK